MVDDARIELDFRAKTFEIPMRLVNFGILPLTFKHGSDYRGIKQGHVLRFRNLRQQVRADYVIEVENVTQKQNFKTRHSLSERQVEILLSGGLINWVKRGLRR